MRVNSFVVALSPAQIRLVKEGFLNLTNHINYGTRSFTFIYSRILFSAHPH